MDCYSPQVQPRLTRHSSQDLEARVELASSSRDEQIEQLRSAVTGLIEENQRLRELLAGVGGFIVSELSALRQQLADLGAPTSAGLGTRWHPTDDWSRPTWCAHSSYLCVHCARLTLVPLCAEFESLISRKSSDRIHEILANGRREATAAAGGSQASPVAGPSGSGSAQKRQRTSDSPVDNRGGVDRGASTSSNGPAPIQRFELPPVAPATLPQLPQYNYGGGAGSSASQLPPLPPAPYPVANVPFSSVRDTPATTADGMPLISTHETQEEVLKRRMAQQAEVKHVADGMGLAPVQDLTQADHDKGVQALFTMVRRAIDRRARTGVLTTRLCPSSSRPTTRNYRRSSSSAVRSLG